MKKKSIIVDKIIQEIAKNQIIVLIILGAAAIFFPIFIDNNYYLGIAIMFFIYSILTLSLNLITGYVGFTLLGQAAFFGLGAYVAAILGTRFQIDFIVGCVAASLFAAIFGAMLALPTLRIRGRYFAIVTLGFSEIMRMIELNWMDLTRGPQGISRIPGIVIFGKDFDSYRFKYYVGLVLLICALYIINSILKSKHGRAIRAIKDDDLAAGAMGVNVYKYTVIIFSISAGIAGMAGAYYAHYMSFIDPNAFNFEQSILILSMAIFGGLGSLPGSILGALALTILPEALRFLSDYRQIIYGFILVLIVIFKPSGIMGKVNFERIRSIANMEKEDLNVESNS
ncbi:branched-chain amino acid ABC transporter permease [Treponema sp. OMZ 792]|uniref:branched-chain amino acid ABC transporter permease n=1 Tax=unclassified Treponema TaxID=2638727 RepID=UPI0020A3ABF9|nr:MULTISPECIES: branched-chain amino acid ABC transporter permease [unclassified Treponema]UTC75525.1 branched-chain amino acid ABC transporter permease [Treponema sp. OMZ 792]UTC79529.1 branched-chain amino acid ABC transporter permease [Treponema sp. OMZ 798]